MIIKDNIPEKYKWITQGAACDYHRLINGPVSIANCTVRYKVWDQQGTWVTWIEEKRSVISADSITPVKDK